MRPAEEPVARGTQSPGVSREHELILFTGGARGSRESGRMVRLLHTADVHLSPDASEREAALAAVLETATEADVDALTVGGDLFDSELAAEQLRERLRERFSGLGFPVVTIPGNHDEAAFGSDLFFGENFVPKTGAPFDHHVVDGAGVTDGRARITCLPYTPRATEDLLVALRDREPFDGPEFLLLHCSLEAPVASGVGDEGERRYCPVTKGELAELGFDYFLAGHFHSRHLVDLPNGGTFVYPGSPASVTRTETGRRTAVLVDTEASRAVQPRYLETFHYDALDLRVTPGDEDAVVEEIVSQVETWDGRQVDASVTVDGFHAGDEAAFAARLDDASGDVPVENATRTVEHVLSHPLFETFRAELVERDELHAVEDREAYDPEAFTEEVAARTLEVFAELAAEGELS